MRKAISTVIRVLGNPAASAASTAYWIFTSTPAVLAVVTALLGDFLGEPVLFIAALGLGIVAIVLAAVGYVRSRSVQYRIARSRGGLQFGAVEVGKSRPIYESNVFTDNWNGAPIVFNLLNPQGGSRACDIRPTVTVKDTNGNLLAGPTNARWANPQSPNTEEVERDIPANGAPVAIDTVIQGVMGDRFWLVTDESLRQGIKANSQAITEPSFDVTLVVQGENVPPISKTIGITLGFPLPVIHDPDAIQDLTKTREFPGPGKTDPVPQEDDLPSALDSLIREGMTLYTEFSAPVEPERRGGTIEVAGGDAPDGWHERAISFRQKIQKLLEANAPGLLAIFRDGCEAHQERAKAAQETHGQGEARDERSGVEKAIDLATWHRGGPALEVEITLEGLAAIRNHLGY